ncbi:MAG: hypothetical protein ACI9QN_001465 [Arcticibacterium sp.]|jgi:hypothetical protein
MKHRTNLYKIIALACMVLLGAIKGFAQTGLGHFNKVTVNPNIEVVFRQGNQENVRIEKANIDKHKVLIETTNGRLKLTIKGWNEKKRYNPHNGTKASLVVTYRNIEELILKGDQEIIFEDALRTEDFKLNIYGDSEITLNEVHIDNLESNIYGDNTLEIKSGNIAYMDYTVYGDCTINTRGVDNYETKIMAFGDADFDISVTDYLKINALGDTYVTYKGNPRVNKGLSLGDTTIRRAK